jgi:superfamily II DNA/RNA helicase
VTISSSTFSRRTPRTGSGSRRSGGGRPGRADSRPHRSQPVAAAAPPEVLWTVPESGMPTFAELGLPDPVLRALDAGGFGTPFPIQAATLPDTLAGRDLLGRGQTGSGKTLAFGLALLARLAGGRAQARRPRGLVLVPTRELAQQVVDALTPFARALGLSTSAVVGGMSFNRQADALARGVDLLVATPGRLTDHTNQRTCDLSQVTVSAIDEADRMADMGFLPQVRAILDLTPGDGQRLLFSATLDGDVATLVRRYLTDPVTRSVASATAQVETMDHHVLLVDAPAKPRVVTEIAARDGRTILFVRTKHGVDRLVKGLRREGVAAGALHGGKAQNARNRAIAEFKDGRTPVLVATDVAARGIHIDDVSLVVHVDPPADPKDYLHRAGRTARAGDSGTVVTMVTAGERRDVERLTRQAGVRASLTEVGPGDASLTRITGARRPSGVPVVEPVKPAPQPARSGRRGQASAGGRRRRPAPSGRRRDAAGGGPPRHPRTGVPPPPPPPGPASDARPTIRSGGRRRVRGGARWPRRPAGGCVSAQTEHRQRQPRRRPAGVLGHGQRRRHVEVVQERRADRAHRRTPVAAPAGRRGVEALEPRPGTVERGGIVVPGPGPRTVQHHQAQRRRGVLRDQVRHEHEVPGRLGHLLPAHQDRADVQPRPAERPDTGDRLDHRSLVGVMREAQVGTAGVEIQSRAEGGQRHRRALRVPARTALAPRARPGGLAR